MKKCRRCEIEKGYLDFCSRKDSRDGYTSYCRDCTNELAIIYRKNNQEKWEKQKHKNFLKYREKNNIPIDSPKRYGPKGKGSINNYGYRMFQGKKWIGHPCSDSCGRVLEHRLVMYNTINRPFKDGETVHHKNGDRLDNRPENLELWSKKHTPGQRVEDKIKSYIEFLKEYGYEITLALA